MLTGKTFVKRIVRPPRDFCHFGRGGGPCIPDKFVAIQGVGAFVFADKSQKNHVIMRLSPMRRAGRQEATLGAAVPAAGPRLVATLWAYLAPKPSEGPASRDRIVECRMGDVVNLRRARKKAQRELAEREASAKRLLYGRSKAQRDLDSERDAKASRDLERHRIETGDER